MRAWSGVSGWSLLLLAALDLVALRRGLVRHAPVILAALFVAALALLVWRLGAVARGPWKRGERPGSRIAELVLLGGVIAAVGGGTLNWARGLQGVVVLNEREWLTLGAGGALEALEAGPLARVEEMGIELALERLELVAASDASYYPLSHLLIRRGGGAASGLRVTPLAWASFETLRLHQGTFGFAPRIVVVRDEQTVFDRVVPLRTAGNREQGLSFEERFTIGAERLDVTARVELASLDEGMRGHATLALEVRRGEELLGSGTLLPGHFAEIGGGYRVGFAGLARWSEIDLSRRNYATWMKTTAALAALAGLAWPLARWAER